MHQGYYIEKDLIYQADVYGQTFLSHQSEESSALQKEVEGHAGSFQKENFLTKAILMNLREGVRDHARHECQGCRIDHPSQKHHDMCLWTTAEEWINDYKYHEPALECLNHYDVIEDLDEILWEHMMGSKRKSTDAIHLLTPELTIETYKNWQYFKKNQRDMTDQWKTFWAKKLLESYQETDQESTTQEEKTTEENKTKDWQEPSPPPEYEI